MFTAISFDMILIHWMSTNSTQTRFVKNSDLLMKKIVLYHDHQMHHSSIE